MLIPLSAGSEDEDDRNNFTTPYIQKGGRGNFGNAGLIEWAAEKANVNNGQGFIPFHPNTYFYHSQKNQT